MFLLSMMYEGFGIKCMVVTRSVKEFVLEKIQPIQNKMQILKILKAY